MRTISKAGVNEAAEHIMSFNWGEAVLSMKKTAGESKTKEKKRIRLRRIYGTGKSSGHHGHHPDSESVFFIQIEEITDKKAAHHNYAEPEFKNILSDTILPECSSGEFFSADGILSLKKNKRGEISLLFSKNTVKTKSSFTSHDKQKESLLPENEPVPFLIDLGIMTETGKIIQGKNSKFRQINRFLEFIRDILPQIKHVIQRKGKLVIADFGCGKSYLTFAVYYFLKIRGNLPVEITGLDLKKEVIDNCNSLAEKYGYTSMKFLCGDIGDFAKDNHFDMMLTLHACDTATDAALAKAIQSGTEIILSVPCCQHELNAQIENSNNADNHILTPVFKYGILRERVSAVFTDALRAALLTENGYNVQVLEFIDMQHTAKNILIRAVKSPQTNNNMKRQKAAGEYRRMTDFLGVNPALEKMLLEGRNK